VFINPRIVGASEETALSWEGCLSFAELLVLVERRLAVRVEYLNAQLETRQMVAQTIRLGSNPVEIRNEYQRRLNSENRNWSVTKGEKLGEFDLIRWSYTLADVPLDSPERYVAAVRRWAMAV
jgi:hypothetical protein